MLRLLYRDQRCGEGKKDLTVARWPTMWCSECRFSGVRGGQRCGVVNADLAVSAVIIDVGERIQMLWF